MPKHRKIWGLRDTQKLLVDAPPMACHYQRLAHVNNEKQSKQVLQKEE